MFFVSHDIRKICVLYVCIEFQQYAYIRTYAIVLFCGAAGLPLLLSFFVPLLFVYYKYSLGVDVCDYSTEMSVSSSSIDLIIVCFFLCVWRLTTNGRLPVWIGGREGEGRLSLIHI